MEESSPKYKAILAESNVEGHCHSILEVYVKDDWTLMLEGYDVGPFVKEHWGDSDYEYFLWVKPVDVPKVLIELIKDRFSSDADFRMWLESKGVKFETYSYA